MQRTGRQERSQSMPGEDHHGAGALEGGRQTAKGKRRAADAECRRILNEF